MFQNVAADPARTRAAIAELARTHFARMTRYIAMRTGNLTDAEDMASEVFIRALRAADSYKDTGAPMEAWLFRIAHNLVANYFRDKSRRPEKVPLETIEFRQSDGHDPDDQLIRQEEATRLNKALQYLTESQRQVLALRFAGGMTSEEVAQVLGKKPGAIREMQSAAIKRLREVLGDTGASEFE